MNIHQEIAKTETYKQLVLQTSFLRTLLLKKQSTDSIERIVYQIQKLGVEYIGDKGYDDREVRIAKEIIENVKNSHEPI